MENKTMNKRVQGVLGVSSIRANFNAAFDGYPKMMGDGTIIASDKAFKYPMKKMLEEKGYPILYIKTMTIKERTEDKIKRLKLVPRSLDESYEHLYGVKEGTLAKYKDIAPIVKNLYQAADVKQFGATFAVAKINESITGAVQIGQGVNIYEDSQSFAQDILSPFRSDSTKKDKDGNDKTQEKNNSTLGTKVLSDEAHYIFPFTINPRAYREDIELGLTEGYTEEDYQLFKRTALTAVTAYDSNSKKGCENEFGLFIESTNDLILDNFDERYISFAKGDKDTKNVIEFKDPALLKGVDRIQKIEVYYNPFTTELKGFPESAEYYDIRTMARI